MIEIKIVLSCFRDLPRHHSLREARAAEDYVGSMLRSHVHVLRVPRIGDGLTNVGPWSEPISVWITSVNHRLDLSWELDPTVTKRVPPEIEVIAHAPWRPRAERDGLVEQFKARGWHWTPACD